MTHQNASTSFAILYQLEELPTAMNAHDRGGCSCSRGQWNFFFRNCFLQTWDTHPAAKRVPLFSGPSVPPQFINLVPFPWMADDIEYVTLNKKECFAYNVPPPTSAAGYKAADWSNCIWKGRLQVCSKGEILVIKLLDANSGAIFAACPVPPNVEVDKIIERTVDSSRYFVLTMSDKSGRKAHLGMGFDDRNDAFDFNATIQDFKRQKEAPQEVKPIQKIQPPGDLALKEGQKITVNLKPLKAPPSSQSAGPAMAFLPPPPGKSRQVAEPTSTGDLLDFGESFSSAPSEQPKPPSGAVTTTTSLLD